MKTSLRYAVALLSVAAGALGTAPGAHAARMFSIGDSDNVLRSFDTGAPAPGLSSVVISGLGAGESVSGIDVRPSTGELYAVTTASRLYVLNPASGEATAVGAGAFSPLLTGSIGMDFNPVADRVRARDDAGLNLQRESRHGSGNSGHKPQPVSERDRRGVQQQLRRSRIDGPLRHRHRLRRAGKIQNPPNNGTLTTVGALGLDAGSATGFDIDSAGTRTPSLSVGGINGLYQIDLAGGVASARRDPRGRSTASRQTRRSRPPCAWTRRRAW